MHQLINIQLECIKSAKCIYVIVFMISEEENLHFHVVVIIIRVHALIPVRGYYEKSSAHVYMSQTSE